MIDKTKLIKLGLIALALISMGAFLSWYITSNHYETALATQKSSYDGKLKSISDEAAVKLGNEVDRNNKLQKDLAELEAMKIANLRRFSDNYSEAYDEEAFFYVASQMEALAQRAVEISHEG